MGRGDNGNQTVVIPGTVPQVGDANSITKAGGLAPGSPVPQVGGPGSITKAGGVAPAAGAGPQTDFGGPLANLGRNVGGMLQEEWDRFNKGISGMTPSGREKQRLDRLQEITRERGESSISLPGWDDIIHLGPLANLTDQQRLDRNKEIGQRIRQSPQDSTAKSWGDILTALDNVQDFLTTVTVVGRIVLWPVGKILGRAIPGLGLVLLAADILKLLTLLGTLLMPLYGLVCGNPRGFFAGLGQVAAFGPKGKGYVENLGRMNPFGSAARASRAARLGRLVPGAGEIFEVLQTTDSLFGWGISFGAVVGLLGDAMYGAMGALTGSAPTINLGNLPGAANRLPGAGTIYPTVDAAALPRSASQVLATLPMLTTVQQPLTWEEHAGAIAAGIAAIDVLRAELRGADFIALAEELLDQEWAPPLTAMPSIASEIATDPVASATGPRWPFPGNPRTVTFRELIRFTQATTAAKARELNDNLVDTVEGSFVATLMQAFVERLFVFLLDDPRALQWELTPPYKVLSSMVMANRLVNVGENPESIVEWFEEAVLLLENGDQRSLSQEDLDRLAVTHEINLIHTTPPQVGGADSLTLA